MPVVFVPGLTEFKESFVYQFRGLEDTYRVISYDLRRGLKRADDYTLDLLVEDLQKLFQALDIRRAVICGHSFGGLVAMKYAAKYPESTDALVLVSSFPSPPHASANRLVKWMSSTEHPYQKSLGTKLKMQLSRLFGVKTSNAMVMEDQVQAVRMIAHQASKTSQTTISQRLKIIQNTDLRGILSDIQAPTLIVAGAKDRQCFLSAARDLYEGIPKASLEVIEDAAHLCFVTRHDLFNTLLDDFLSDRLAEIS